MVSKSGRQSNGSLDLKDSLVFLLNDYLIGLLYAGGMDSSPSDFGIRYYIRARVLGVYLVQPTHLCYLMLSLWISNLSMFVRNTVRSGYWRVSQWVEAKSNAKQSARPTVNSLKLKPFIFDSSLKISIAQAHLTSLWNQTGQWITYTCFSKEQSASVG